jgi:hypothetical protein
LLRCCDGWPTHLRQIATLISTVAFKTGSWQVTGPVATRPKFLVGRRVRTSSGVSCGGIRSRHGGPGSPRRLRLCSSALRIGILLVFMSSACTGQRGSPNQRRSQTFIRTCESRVGGLGQLRHDWKAHAVIIGPLAFPTLRFAATYPRSNFSPRNGRYPALKQLVMLKEGAEVTISIRPSDRTRAALLYDPSDWNYSGFYQISEGEPAVTFQACPGKSKAWQDATQFNGGFVVAGPRCVGLEVKFPSSETKEIVVSFGTGACPR